MHSLSSFVHCDLEYNKDFYFVSIGYLSDMYILLKQST